MVLEIQYHPEQPEGYTKSVFCLSPSYGVIEYLSRSEAVGNVFNIKYAHIILLFLSHAIHYNTNAGLCKVYFSRLSCIGVLCI